MLFGNVFERKHNVMLLCNSWTTTFVIHVKTLCINLFFQVTPLSHGLAKQQSLV